MRGRRLAHTSVTTSTTTMMMITMAAVSANQGQRAGGPETLGTFASSMLQMGT
jgi:hypothetical protein